MELFGNYDRIEFAKQGLFSADGCTDVSKLTLYADSDERTRETAKALAKGLMPGCDVPVRSLPEGTNDPLFHPLPDLRAKDSTARARAAIAGRIGGDAANLSVAYHEQIAMLDHILATCGTAPSPGAKRMSLFDVPASLSEGTGDHLAEMKGPINIASTLSENLLLEYTEGMDSAKVGWGCVRTSRSAHQRSQRHNLPTCSIRLVSPWNRPFVARLSLERWESLTIVHSS
jgi:4-phytase/acid phosphatase